MAKEVTKKKRGRKSYKPTPAESKVVQALAGVGVPLRNIAAKIGIGYDSLQKYYQEDIIIGKAEAFEEIANTIWKKAIAGDTALLIFWAKTQMKWAAPPTQLQHSDAHGDKIEVPQVIERIIVKPDGTKAALSK